MKQIVLVFSLLLAAGVSAQTSVVKKSAMKSNGYGIAYTLPKTSLTVEAMVNKVIEKRGPYYAYAERFLQLKNVIAEDRAYYELVEVNLINKGVPDPESSYLIEFKGGTLAPFVYLTKDNLICSINVEVEATASEKEEPQKPGKKVKDAPIPTLTEELLQAGSIAKQSEIAAKQIYRIRESRLNIITGEADNMPPDGEAMKITLNSLDEQEKALMSLFAGTVERTEEVYATTLIPEGELDKEVLFRFSERLGIVDPDDLGGTPIYIRLANLGDQPPLDAKEAAKREKIKGIFYNVPGTGQYTITMGGKTLLKGDTPIVQFGVKEVLVSKMLEDKKAPVRIIFYSETGAIKQIVQ